MFKASIHIGENVSSVGYGTTPREALDKAKVNLEGSYQTLPLSMHSLSLSNSWDVLWNTTVGTYEIWLENIRE